MVEIIGVVIKGIEYQPYDIPKDVLDDLLDSWAKKMLEDC
jgi:hypothetical protein